MNPTVMSLAMITVMLWIVWSDTVRPHRPAPILYAMRIALFLIVSGILALNMFRYPQIFTTGTRVLAVVAILIGIGGATYFARKLTRR